VLISTVFRNPFCCGLSGVAGGDGTPVGRGRLRREWCIVRDEPKMGFNHLMELLQLFLALVRVV
jgi:hypothetical protein